MTLNYALQIFTIGMAIFSMFFGGGNLTFPLVVGSETNSVTISSIGFILTGVLLPFYGIIVSIYFKGDYEDYLNVFGKKFGAFLIFALLLFWIPLGSGPRCNHLAYGAFSSQTGWEIPLWVYSLIYSAIVYVLTVKENRVLEILGKIITPALIFSLFLLILSVFSNVTSGTIADSAKHAQGDEFTASFFAGYNTMDFIAAIFFSSTVINLIRKEQKEKFDIGLVRDSCLIAILLLSIIYVGLIAVGNVYSNVLVDVSRDRLLPVIGQALFDEKFQLIIFIIITLSVLSTSIALSLVFSDYLRITLFNNKVGHKFCLLMVVAVSFLMSIIGFEKLSVLISNATSILYPVLLLTTTTAFIKRIIVFPKKVEVTK